MNRKCDAEDEATIRAGVRRYFPEADGPTMAMKTCLFTNTLMNISSSIDIQRARV